MMQASVVPASPPAPTTPAEALARLTQEPSAVYKAYEAQRSELREQVARLEEQRGDLRREMREATGADRQGLETRLAQVDARIAELDKQVATADQSVAKAAAVPGAIVPDPPPVRQGPPEEVWVLGGVFIVFVLFPMSIAMARRIWKKTTNAVASLPAELMERMSRLDHAVDSIALEVERIGEGQRFMTRVLSDNGNRAIGAGAAVPIDLAARGEAVGMRREREGQEL